MRDHDSRLCAPALVALLLASCGSDTGPSAPPPRPVTYVELRVTNPAAQERVTGSVESWKREDIGFEVSGRVVRVADPGTDIEGHTYTARGPKRAT